MGVASPLKWHGGKHYLASRIVAMMPPHVHYVEPYAGGLSVLLARDPEGVSEVANDIDGELSNFWRVLADRAWFNDFARAVQAIPFSEWHWQSAARMDPDGCTSAVTRAVAFFVLVRQSLAGRRKLFAPLTRSRTRRGMSEQASAWLTAVEGLPEVHARLKRVVVLNRPALDVIRQQDGPGTLFYLDPPYLHETRATTSDYRHEMDETDHHELLCMLANRQGKFLLSGYRSKLYDDAAALHGWHRTDFDLPNNAAGGAEKRRMVESVWSNFQPAGRPGMEP